MSRISNVVFLGLLTSTTACLLPQTGPKSGAIANGQQLAVVDDLKVWTTTSKEKVAETEYTDGDGHVVGHGAVYQDKETVHSQKIWYGVQGNQQLADEDFFRIAGDQKALDETLAMRADGKKWQHRGWGTMAGGIVGMVASYFIPNVPIRLTLDLAGALAVGAGYYMSWHGAQEVNQETHAVDRSVVERDAMQYNQSLGGKVGINYAKKF